jgi:hypothetical protein
LENKKKTWKECLCLRSSLRKQKGEFQKDKANFNLPNSWASELGSNRSRAETKQACRWLMDGETFVLHGQRSLLGVSTRPTVIMPHSPSRTFPRLDEVMRAFDRQTCLETTLACRNEEHHEKWKELEILILQQVILLISV